MSVFNGRVCESLFYAIDPFFNTFRKVTSPLLPWRTNRRKFEFLFKWCKWVEKHKHTIPQLISFISFFRMFFQLAWHLHENLLNLELWHSYLTRLFHFHCRKSGVISFSIIYCSNPWVKWNNNNNNKNEKRDDDTAWWCTTLYRRRIVTDWTPRTEFNHTSGVDDDCIE